jgi:hypothetical protein
MTAKELLKILNTFPENQTVVVQGYEGGYCDIDSVKSIKVTLNHNTESWNGPHEDLADSANDVVFIRRAENPISK